jgi:hypothetical protein
MTVVTVSPKSPLVIQHRDEFCDVERRHTYPILVRYRNHLRLSSEIHETANVLRLRAH